ncbi:hypothetical protein [Christiangramia salexigens]|uniref:Uncharacterized protein n=1 Tax=Christiangramia salexigens TaxID=1913577 RepID=A0A1L3J7V7_9FLAO|nr:hypothetical protein [Christiangramia salexigens]APG61208.1 hypothetical protein LPB144_12695 [Christiangramia salexigens]
MVSNRFEDHVKSQLSKREIRPSAESWKKLSGRLDETAKPVRYKWWFTPLAAGLALVVASLIFVKLNNLNEVPVVNAPEKFEEPQILKKDNYKTKEGIIAGDETIEKVLPASENSVKRAVSNKSVYKTPVSEKIATINTEVGELNRSEMIGQTGKELKDQIFEISEKIDQLLTKVAKKEAEKGEVTDAEVDALLAEAAKKISQRRKYINAGEVSPGALLAEVEFEMDQSFRKEIFEFLKEEFLKARTAIVTRNK